MILKLLIKNLKVSYRKSLPGIAANAFLAGWFIISFYDWEVFLMLGYLTISFHCAFLIDTERKNSNEIFTLSLPCDRKSIVASSFTTALIITLTGFIIWISAALFWDLILHDELILTVKILRPKVLLMASIFIAVNQSIYIPASLKLEQIYSRIIFGIALVISVIIIANVFAPYRASYNPELVSTDIPMVIFFLIFLGLLLTSSFYLSQKFYSDYDL